MDDFKEYVRTGGRGPLPAYEQVDGLLASYPWFTTARVVRAILNEGVGTTDQLLKLHLSVVPAPAGRLLPVSAAELEQFARRDGDGATAERVRADGDRIIEKFLDHGEYRIVPAQDAPAGEAAPAGDEEFALPGIVTEQLADIYMKQQLWPQAKAVYEKLSLLYPKKSVYFAEIIERINARSQGQNN